MNKADEWRNKADTAAETLVMPLPLPSGMTISARRPGPLRFAQWGRLPMMIGRLATGATISNEEIVELMTFLRELLVWCVVDPPIAVDGGAESMQPSDVPDMDLYFIANWAMRVGEAQEMRPFRGGRTDVGGDGGREDVGMPTIEPTGNRGPGTGADGGPGGDAAGDGDGVRRRERIGGEDRVVAISHQPSGIS